jgi:cation diffusion facilitator family transporter
VPPSSNENSTRRTVLVAGAANVVVLAAKLAAGLISGSSAMLAEAAHSAADTLNQAFLLTSVHKSGRPADSGHPFGYGQERYFWSLLAAFGIFIAGAGFSVFEGLLTLFHSSSDHGTTIAYIVLGVSAIAEGTSLLASATPGCWNTCATAPTPPSRPRCSRTAPRWWASSWPPGASSRAS